MGERKTPEADLPRPLTRLDAVTLVIGAMVGSGVYIVSAEMLRQVRAPGLLLLAWVAAALVTVIGALSYGELAGMFPDTGGQYVYLREGISPLAGYLYGWTLFAVIQTGGIAAVAIAFARFATVFVPSLSARAHVACTLPLCGHVAFGIEAQHVLAAVLVAATTAVNVRGVKPAARLQGALTVVNVIMLVGVVVVAISAGRNADALRENFGAGFLSASEPLHAMVPAFAASMVAALFAMDAWNNVGFSAGELRRPTRDVPFAMAAGVLAVTALYVLVNVAYLAVLPAPAIAHAADDRVATAVLEASLGKPGLYAAAGVIVLSTLGCAHGLVLSGARVYYAMARDGLFFRAMGKLHPRYETPAFGLVTQAVWAIVLCLSGSYAQLLDCVMIAGLLFYALTVCGLFALRARRPDVARPVRAPGYPFLPALYVAITAAVATGLGVQEPRRAGFGLAVVALGIPVYWAWRARGRRGGAGGPDRRAEE